MAAPWAGFGGMQFNKEEHAIWGTDPGWNNAPKISRTSPLGSATDVMTALAIGSRDRVFEMFLTPARFEALRSLINTTGLFTDWERPIPDSRQAFLVNVESMENVISSDTHATKQRKIHTRVTLVSQ